QFLVEILRTLLEPTRLAGEELTLFHESPLGGSISGGATAAQLFQPFLSRFGIRRPHDTRLAELFQRQRPLRKGSLLLVEHQPPLEPVLALHETIALHLLIGGHDFADSHNLTATTAMPAF